MQRIKKCVSAVVVGLAFSALSSGVVAQGQGSVEHNRVLVFPAAEFFYEGPDVAAGIVVPQGELVPVAEESFNHGARTRRIGPDLGQPSEWHGRRHSTG